MKKLKYLGNISNFLGVLRSRGGGNLGLMPGSIGGPGGAGQGGERRGGIEWRAGLE